MKIEWVQATAIMDTIANYLCYIPTTPPNEDNLEIFTETINDLSRNCFLKVCDILNITNVEMD